MIFIIVLIILLISPIHGNASRNSSAAFVSFMNQSWTETNERINAVRAKIFQLLKSDPEFWYPHLYIDCYKAIEHTLVTGYQEEWSAKLINSNSYRDGTLMANLMAEKYTNLGDFDQCLAHRDHPAVYQGKYCLVKLLIVPNSTEIMTEKPNNTFHSYSSQIMFNWARLQHRFPYVNAVCVPSVCSAQHIKLLIDKYFQSNTKGLELEVGQCQMSNDPNVEASLEVTISGFVLLVFLLLVTTAAGLALTEHIILKRQLNTRLVHLLACFNPGQNLRQLFHVSPYTESDTDYDLRSFHLCRVLFIMFIITTHCITFNPNALFAPVLHFDGFETFFRGFFARMPRSLTKRGGFFADSFFMISGFLITHLARRQLKQLPGFFAYLALRWCRTAPTIIAYLCLNILLQAHATGPLAHPDITNPYVEPCVKYWWSNLLFINNYFRADRMCGFHLWYVAVDFQLYALLYPILWLRFTCRQSLAFLSSVGFCFVAIGAQFVQLLLNYGQLVSADFFIRFDTERPWRSFFYFYTSPVVRIVPYFTGVLLALYLANKQRSIVLKPPKAYQDLVYIALWVLLVGCYFIPSPVAPDSGKLLNLTFYLLINTVYMGLNARLTYVVLCHRNTAMKKLFSSATVTVISRLTYGLYIIHPTLIWYNLASIRRPIMLTAAYQIQFTCSIILQSLIGAFIMFIGFEAPFYNLCKLLVASKRDSISAENK